MFENSDAYSGMSSNDTVASRAFYEGVLGLTVVDEAMGGVITVKLPKGGAVLIYPKGDHHVPATFTVLNFPVDDVDAAVDELIAKGVTMERYEGLHQDDRGIMRGRAAGRGPDQAWFTDPAGNILSVLH
jgi:catechol 2,3-dioxygenase-like lactoylglutathione lyase family enzyme